MKVRRAVGRGLKSLVDFRRWMGWNQVKDSARGIQGLAKTLMTPREAKHQESFEEAVKRLKLTEEMLEKQASRFLNLTITFGVLTLAMFSYTVYLLFTARLQGFLLGSVVTVLASTFTFREHFHYFQIKTRQLGCSFKDWLHFCMRKKEAGK